VMLYFARMTREARLQLLSAYENIELAQRVLGELCGSADIDDETTYWVGMALREALANAIKHGNKHSSEKRVLVHMLVVDGQLQIEVEDEGDGFDPACLQDPTSPGNLLRSSGRGVFYMHQFMDEVNFRAGELGGTRVELRKQIGARRVS
jgi:serine/threonine-protein kinase RsbW